MTRLARRAATVRDLRQVQAVLLPLLGLSLKDTALATGSSMSWVAKQRAAAVRSGGLVSGRARGGRRHGYFPSFEAEREYVSSLIKKRLDAVSRAERAGVGHGLIGALPYLKAHKLTVTELQSELQQALGRPVSRSGALGFGRRHRLVAPTTKPR